MIRGIAVTYLHSPHGQALAEWYARTLGLEIAATYPEWVEFRMPQGSRFGVDVTGFPRSSVEKQPVMISFEVDDIHATVSELAGKGVRFHPSQAETIFDVGPALVATFVDPDGNFTQISQRKPK